MITLRLYTIQLLQHLVALYTIQLLQYMVALHVLLMHAIFDGMWLQPLYMQARASLLIRRTC